MRLALAGAAIAVPVGAETIQFNAVVGSEIGYSVNPRLVSDVNGGSIYASASIAPRLVYQTERSSTELQGDYERETYLRHFGYTDSGSIGLVRTDKLSQYLSSTLTGRYQTSNRATIDDTDNVEDPLTIGRRTRTAFGSYQLQWQASARDQFSYGAQVNHQSYGKDANLGTRQGLASSYTQYTVDAGYNRIVDARTSVGAQISLSTTHSALYPGSRVIQPSFTAKRQLSAVWTIDGHVGVVLQNIYGPLPSSSTSLGYGANLCGAYPRTNLCIQVSRDTSPSGYGSLRTVSQIGLHLTRDLDERSHVAVDAKFLKSSTGGVSVLGTLQPRPDSRALELNADYDRDITQRISAGFGGRYQRRELSTFPNARSYTAMIHVKAKLGRM